MAQQVRKSEQPNGCLVGLGLGVGLALVATVMWIVVMVALSAR